MGWEWRAKERRRGRKTWCDEIRGGGLVKEEWKRRGSYMGR